MRATVLRSVAEHLSRGRSFRHSLPAVYGGCRMYISPEAGLRYWLPRRALRMDLTLLNNAAETVKPGSVVWDVGANMGLFTFAAAGLAGQDGRVYSFEPDAVMANLLRRSSRLNPRSAPVEIIPCAISESQALARFNVARRSRTSNYLEGYGRSQTGGIREVETVITLSLDWMAAQIPLPDVLKIDVEGAELEVLRGATQVLHTKRPALIFEMTPVNWDEISGMLRNLDYVLFDADEQRAKRQPLAAPCFNVLALPA